MLLYQFTRPFAFRRIKHPDLKLVNVRLPLGIMIVCIATYVLLPITPPLFGERSVTGHALSVLALLPGFFIAALAAVATFQRALLDETMPAPAPTLEMRTGGDEEEVALTHRVFLCHLFSYLTVLSFASIALCAIGDLAAPSVVYLVDKINVPVLQHAAHFSLKLAYLASLVWLLSNLVVTTLYGLYFLVERIHRPHS